MIPNIISSILNRNNNNNNNSDNNNNSNNNNNNNNNSNENTYENLNVNSNENQNNNPADDFDPVYEAERSIHVDPNSDSARFEQSLISQLLEQNQRLSQQLQLQQQQQQQPPTIPTTNGVNLRFDQPMCIMRAPNDSNLPLTRDDQNSSEQPPISTISTIFLPPNYVSPTVDEPIELAKVNNDTIGGLFGKTFDKLFLHVIPVEGSDHSFMNRISYNMQTNAYYENGDLSRKYLKSWKQGAYHWDNIVMKIEFDWMKTYLARTPSEDKMNDDGEISWKFDYCMGEYLINSLNIKLLFGTFDNDATVQWFIKPLSTMKNKDPTWQEIPCDPYTEYRHVANEVKDVTQFVKNEYGFILKARLSGGEKDSIIWQKTQLFRQDWNRGIKDLVVENDDTFGLDVKVELRPDIIVDPLPELSDSQDKPFTLNDESTSDFTIHYEVSAGDETVVESIASTNLYFHVHSKLLSKRSDYFKALLESKMVESQNKSLTLTDEDISYGYLEIILNYLYENTLPDFKNFDEWVTLLHYSSRFLIPTLIQRCEKALKHYLNHDNLSKIESIANEYGAEQLLLCCKNFVTTEE